MDSFIEIGASRVVLWELSETGEARQRRALQLIGIAFVLLPAYLLVESMVAMITGHHASPGMLTGIVLNLVLGWWWADRVAGFVIVYYAVREVIHIFRPGPE